MNRFDYVRAGTVAEAVQAGWADQAGCACPTPLAGARRETVPEGL